MKTLRLLATLLLVALSTGLYSCGKDDLDREPQDQISDGTLLMIVIRSSQSTWMIILTLSVGLL